MMMQCLYKDLRLAAHPTLYIFVFLGALVIVPSYPYSLVFFFGCLSPFITMTYGRETNDIYYTALLPIEKRTIVTSKCFLFAVTQISQLLFSVPFAILHGIYLSQSNTVGLNPNISYYGFGLMTYAIFNFIFLTEFFKTAYKTGKAFIFGIIPVVICMIAVEILPHLPGTDWLNSTVSFHLLLQLPILACGILCYTISMIFTNIIAGRHFEKVDL